MQSVSNSRTQEGWVYPVFNYEVLHEHIRTMAVHYVGRKMYSFWADYHKFKILMNIQNFCTEFNAKFCKQDVCYVWKTEF